MVEIGSSVLETDSLPLSLLSYELLVAPLRFELRRLKDISS